MATYMLIDGNSLTYRAFFALPTDMATASGQVTNAVFGFTSMLINLIRDHQPDEIVATFDRPEPTFRHEMVDTYKAGREAAPDILRQQMGLVRQVVEILSIPIVEKVGFEADDVIATLATQARDNGDDVLIVTGDRDSYQLVEDPHIRVLYNKRGVSDYALYDEAGIEERTGVHPTKYVQYAALRGDKSDNLPGVPGVGEKTAAKLVNKYGDIDGIFANTEDQTPKLRQNLEENEAQARSNVDMMVLVRDVPLEATIDDLKRGEPDLEAVRELFDFLEFRSLYDRLAEALDMDLGGAVSGLDVLEAEVSEVSEPTAAVALINALGAASNPLAIAASETGLGEGLAVVTDPETAEVAFLPVALFADAGVRNALSELFGAGGRPVAAHGAKPLLRDLLSHGIDMRDLQLDTMLAAYLLDPAESRYLLDEILVRYASLEMPSDDATPADGQLDFGGDAIEPSKVAARAALAVDRLIEPLGLALAAQGLSHLNETIEVPLVRVLAKMENLGIGVDVAELERLRNELRLECDRLRIEIIEAAGEDFNVNSTKQLREILFEKLKLTPQKKTKTGYSTDAASLEKMKGEHPVVDFLLEYREVEKLRSTYGEGLLAEVGEGDRIRATFNQTVARTGRLSSDAPNLHNIPVRSETGRVFRKAFVAAEGYELLVADYNQIELRCIAHLAEDPGLVGAFERGDDIHAITAASVFHVEPDDVTIEQRSKAKMVSYGLAYGMEAYGLAQRLAIPVPEAAEILDAYFTAFPAVRAYMDNTVEEARRTGLYRDALRAPSQNSRAGVGELPHPPGRRTAGDERWYPGPRRRHLQGRPGASRRSNRGERQRESNRAAGARRSDPRSAASRTRDDRGNGDRRHGQCFRPAGAARGQYGPRPDLGGCKGVSESAGQHWFEAIASHLGPAYLRYSFTYGTRQEVEFLVAELGLEPGMRVLDVGCGPGRHSYALAERGIEVVGVDVSEAFVELAASKAPEGTTFRCLDANNLDYDAEFDAVISLCQGAFGLPSDPGVPASDRTIFANMIRALRPGGRLAISAFSAYFQVRYLEDSDTFDANVGVNHERTVLKNSTGDEVDADLWTSCFTPRELRMLCELNNAFEVGLYSVSPGAYHAAAPTVDSHEFLLVAQRSE